MQFSKYKMKWCAFPGQTSTNLVLYTTLPFIFDIQIHKQSLSLVIEYLELPISHSFVWNAEKRLRGISLFHIVSPRHKGYKRNKNGKYQEKIPHTCICQQFLHYIIMFFHFLTWIFVVTTECIWLVRVRVKSWHSRSFYNSLFILSAHCCCVCLLWIWWKMKQLCVYSEYSEKWFTFIANEWKNGQKDAFSNWCSEYVYSEMCLFSATELKFILRCMAILHAAWFTEDSLC